MQQHSCHFDIFRYIFVRHVERPFNRRRRCGTDHPSSFWKRKRVLRYISKCDFGRLIKLHLDLRCLQAHTGVYDMLLICQAKGEEHQLLRSFEREPDVRSRKRIGIDLDRST